MVTSLRESIVLVLILQTVILLPGTNSRQVRCLENERFYRDPDRPTHKLWNGHECSKYFLCLEGEVFEFRCSTGLLFDIDRQICDFAVDNCDVTAESSTKVSIQSENCTTDTQLSCSDGTCIPKLYFCDGSIDCADGSDEDDCDSTLDPNIATPCNTTTCRLPNCFCSSDGSTVPGMLSPSEVPQMILITFDGSINSDNWDLYNRLFLRNNPNGCPIKATFFVTHRHNNYYYTQKLSNDGHEIALNSITHRGPENWWSYNATIEDWFDEMVGGANILNKFAKVKLAEVRGIRVPFLKVGWNKQFLMMKEFGFVYDSSMVAPFSDTPLWPYTLDHKQPHNCLDSEKRCPTHAYQGIWEMVLNQILVSNNTCVFVEDCLKNHSIDDTYNALLHNFKRHYFTNRAPFGLYFHSKWFKRHQNLIAFENFLDEISKQSNVWLVSNWQAIEWIKNPTPSNHLNNFKPWNCKKRLNVSKETCARPNECKFSNFMADKEIYLHTCSPCPNNYPWIKNEFGKQ